MGCVNKASKEFKDLAARHDVAENALELITHKYWLETGNETLFPTDVYIQAQLGNTFYKESGKNVRMLWDKAYSSPKEFTSMGELQVAYREAEKYFPKSALVHYQNAKGNYVLSVKKPVESVNYTKDDFFNDEDSFKSARNAKTLDLGLKDKKVYGIDKVKELYDRFNTDRTSKDLAEKVFKIANELNLKVSFNENLPFGTLGRYQNNNTITYKKSFFERDVRNNTKAPILLHEILHAVSMYALSDSTKNWERSKDIENFKNEMTSVFQDLKDNPILKGERGIVDVKEFVAELANPVFRAKIQEIDKQNKEKKTFWSRILDAFKSLLGLHVTHSYYQRSMNALDKALNSFDMDSYMRYNGIKNLLRLGYNAKDWDFRTLPGDKLKDAVKDYFDKETYSDELLSLKKKALADGTFMKAPNGKSTNLSERQWLQVRTKAFKDWFGDWQNNPSEASKVVDENGEPLVLHHFATDTFNIFDSKFNRGNNKGFYFGTINQAYARSYMEEDYVPNSRYLDVFLNLRNPKLTTFDKRDEDYNKDNDGLIIEVDESDAKDLANFAEDLENWKYFTKEWVVKNPNQIKSATDNVGTFYTDNNEIYNYEVDNSNINDLISDNEKEEILREIRTINEAKRSLIDTGGDFLYVVDHTDKNGLKHLKGNQEGFLVKEIINIKGFSREEIINIKQLCNEEGLGGTLQNINQLLERNGYKPSIHNSDSIDAEDKRSNSDNAGLDKQASQGETRRGQSSQNSQESFSGGQIKTGYDGTNHPRYMDVKAIKEFIDNASAEDLKEALRRIEQEDADYDLVNGVEKKKKSFNFDFEKPKTQMEKDLEAIKVNDWNLPEEVREKVEKKLEKYLVSKSGEVQQDIDVSPYFGKDNKTTAKNVLEYIIENSTDREIKDMAQYVLDNLGKNTDVPVEFFQHRGRKKGSHGTYYASTHSIEIDAKALTGANAKEALNRMEGTIIHEITHAITARAMDSDPNARKEILEIFSEFLKLRSQYGITLGYAAKNPKEFVADFLGNKAFREALMELPSSTKKVTLGQKILNFIKRILGIPVKNTFFDRADDAILRLMDYANAREWDNTQSEDEDMSTPQTFTFADGTTVRAPFKPNAQQIDALNEMDRFIKSDETSMTLSGYAGTGKTSIMQMLAEKAKKQHGRVEFCASTNKAAAVLNDKVSKSGFQASTLNKLFGIAVEVDPNSKSYNAKNLVNALKDNNLFVGTTVFIDEASMINEENYNTIKEIAENNHLKIIFVGDEAQLAPVNEDDISKVFRNGDGKVIRLTQVERTGDNAILKEATDLRNNEPLSGVSSFNTKGEGVAYIAPQHQEAIDEVVEHFVPGLKKDPNHFRILAYTNKAVAKYNDQVRDLLGYTTPVPQVGEPMMGYSNWGYTWDYRTRKGYYKLLNSESYKVMSVGKPIKVTHSVNGIPIVMEAIPVTLEDSLGKRDTFNYMDIKSNPQNRHNAEILANEKNRLWKEAKKRGIGRDVRIALYNKINDIEKFLFVNDAVTGDEGNVLQSKVIDFGYAMTVHKSQGSTFTNVLVDDVDISRAGLNTRSNQNYSEAISLEEDTTNIPSEDNLNSMSEVIDLGDLSGVSTEESSETKAPEQASKLIQQLEYVAVSRATDTVTVISSDVKKEDSPLHYIKDTKNTETVSDTTHLNSTPANNVATVQTTPSAPFKYTYQSKFNGSKTVSFNSLEQAVQYFRMEELFNYFVSSIPSSISYYGKNGAKEEYARLKSLMGTLKYKILNAKTSEELAKYSNVMPTSSDNTIQGYIDDFFMKTNNKDLEGNLRRSNIWESLEPNIRYSLTEEMQEQNKNLRQSTSNSQQEKYAFNFKPSEATFYSGAADGSDKAWEAAATKAGIKVHNYTVESWDDLSETWKAKLDKEYQEVLNVLHWSPYAINSYIGKLVRRDMMQADKADAIFAVGTINPRNGYIAGGTGYASTRGILRGIPVYLFDQKDSTWKVWDKTTKKFVPTSQPALTKNAAVIGTRELQENGKKAIEDMFQTSNSNIEYKNDGEVSIEYTPTGKERQTYTIKGNQIFNKEGKEVFKEDSADRNKIFANLAVQQGRAVVVEHNNRKYVVNNRSQIISATTGKLLQWRNDNGDRRAIIKAAGEKFKERGVKAAMEKSVHEAHKDVLNTLGNDEQAQAEVQSTLKTAVMGIALEKALDAVKPVFTKEEQEQIKKALGEDKKLQVMSVSRMTDPVFFTKEIINFLAENAKKPFTDATRVNAVEIWSKHDGIPMQDLLRACKKYKVAPMVSFSITGLGDTTLERGVMKYNDLLDRIEKYIKAGDLNPNTTTIRIDPILIGETNLDDIKAIVNRAKSMGIKKFVSSLVQSYGYLDGTPRDRKVTSGINTAMAREHRTYDWDKYYGRITQEDFAASETFVNKYRATHPRASWLEMVSAGAAEGVRVVSRSSIGKIHFIPKQEYIEEIGKVLLEINKDPEIELETCSFVIKGLRASACLDPLILERITGVDVTDPNGRYKRDTSRPDCMCYGAHSDMFRMNEKKCFSSCAYCYAGKSDSSAISYYNEDGSLKDTIYTRTEEPVSNTTSDTKNLLTPDTKINTGTEDFSDVFQTPNTSEVEVEDVMKPWKNDASKANKSRRIYLKGQKDKGYFEVVKDMEDNNYSIHFKPTDSKNPNAFTEEEKNILFQAAADVIPEGANLSTWGELSKGGIHGLNRFFDLGFVKTGDRNVKMKTGEDVNIPILTKSSEASVDKLSSKTVSLPGYEKLNGFYDDTSVDAEWKIPYLKELDAQISGEKSEEENNNIINKMNTILQATSEKEYQQETQNPKEAETRNILNEYDKLLKQFDNLLDNEDGLTASEIRHIAELVGNDLSDMITDLQKEKGLAKEQFPSLKTDLDFQSASRRKVAETVDINRLIDRCRKLFSNEVVDYDDVDQMLQADVIIDNFDAIMHLAADVFALNEGFGIVKDYKTGKYKLTKQPPRIDYDNFHDYSNDEDVAAENGEKDGQEHWQVESRTIDVLTSMSALVRQALHDCYLLDENGNKIYSRWQIAERINPRDAVNSILRWTQGSQSLEDMVSKLSQKQEKNPWLSQLTTRLSDTSGKETDFQSQFYGVMSKHFQSYSIIVLEDGKYHNVPVNNHPALSEAMKTITAQFKMGELPLFGDNGKVNAKVLGNDNTTGENNDFNFHKALAELQTIRAAIDHGDPLEEKDMETASANIMGICRNFGYNVTEDMVSEILDADNIRYMTEKFGFLVGDLDKALKDQKSGKLKVYDPFKFKGKYAIDTTLKNFLTPITEVLEDTAINAFYDSGKMYQSYVIPSYWSMLMNKFNLKGQQFEDFIRENYASSEWFRDKKAGFDLQKGWRNEWLRQLATDENARKVFSHKVELNFNKHNYMRNMSDAEYTVSMIAEYFAENTNIAEDLAPSWYRVPMQSNKPSSEYIRFYSYRGDKYKDSIVYGLTKMFLQELSRIQTVRMRNLSKEDPEFIKNFDSNGRKFCFLPVFNNYLEDSRVAEEGRTVLKNKDGSVSSDNNLFARLLQKKIKGEEALTKDEDAKFNTLSDKIIRNSVEDRVQKILSEWEEAGIIEAAKAIKGIYPTELDDADATNWTKEQIENFLWNDTFASKNILQLTITDIAFYKDAEDLQKRLAQLHAPGIRPNVRATDYEGNLVSDGKYRTFVVRDYDDFVSDIVANLNVVFDRKIAAAQGKNKEVLIALKDSLTRPRTYNEDGTVKDKGGKYWNINVTDAQGYSSPTSYRKKAFEFGKWSRQAERIYQKLLKGTYKYTDLETAFQPLKPFVYAKLNKNLGVDKAPITSMPIPFQAKNAEYLLIMADAILQGEKNLPRPNLLRAIYRIMEDSAYDGRERDSKGNIVKEGTYNGKGIDTVQFESAIKSSLQGAMDIHQFLDMQEGEEAAYTFMKNQIYKEKYIDSQLEPGKKERVYDEYNTDVFVHETSFDHYCLQQEVPEHFKEHSQTHGSQIRMITPSDLDLYTTDENGNQITNYYTWKEPDGTVKKVTAEECRNEYEETIAANIEKSIDVLRAELHLDIKPDSSNEDIRKEQNIALSRILQSEILASPRYGVDLLQACSIDKETGEFRIPKGDPIQAKRIEQLINSIIKNRINKQEIAGGPIVQVSNFGTSKRLHIRFNDKEGNLIPLKEEYKASEHGGLSYEDYIKKHQGGIAYFEVYAPIWANDVFDKFANPDGTINVEAIEATDPELLKMVSYRIPTEDKYSCAPMKVVGFMPKEAGDAIMFPFELTEIDDSDFDVDKRYVMRKDIPILEKDPSKFLDNLVEKGNDLYKNIMGQEAADGYVRRMVESILKNPRKFFTNSPFRKALFSEYQKVAYYTEAPVSGRKYRDNKIVDMTFAVLTNEMTADKILNPGGFDGPKKMGYMVTAYKNPEVRAKGYTWEDLQKMSTDDLKKLSYTDKDLTYADTQVQFYKQNSAAASLIGVFAVNKVAHATLESNDIWLDVAELCGDDAFNIAGHYEVDEETGERKVVGGMTFQDRMQIDVRHDIAGNLIGKTLGSLVSASADAVKDPILNLMNINMTTAGMLNTMLRLGMTFEDASLFLSQDIIGRLLTQFNRENLTNYVSLAELIDKWIFKYKEKNKIVDSSKINTEALTKEELIEGITPEKHGEIDYKVLLAFKKLQLLTDAMRKPTFATRFNSISSAVGPLILDNLIQESKRDSFLAENGDTHFYTADGREIDINDIFSNHPILKQFSRTLDIAKNLFLDMPSGSTGFRNLLRQVPDDILNRMYNDKKLFDKLANFYQSYLLIQSGVINQDRLKYYVNEFPKEFNSKKYKEKYPNNELLKEIKLQVSKSGKPYLQIKITGMDEQRKEELRSAWIDLHKADPELSKKLFDYSFFIAGIGFSPKTFMALVPTYVKERLKGENGASYVDTYRNFPTVMNDVVIDQFVCNNWSNNKLVPIKKSEDYHFIINTNNNILTVSKENEKAELKNVSYMKVKIGDNMYLYKQKEGEGENGELMYERLQPLGNNGEYLEMHTSKINHPLTAVTKTTEEKENESSDLKTSSPQETDATSPSTETVITVSEQKKNIAELIDAFMVQNPAFTRTSAKEKIEEIKKRGVRKYLKFLQNVFEKKGLHLNLDEVEKEFEKYC